MSATAAASTSRTTHPVSRPPRTNLLTYLSSGATSADMARDSCWLAGCAAAPGKLPPAAAAGAGCDDDIPAGDRSPACAWAAAPQLQPDASSAAASVAAAAAINCRSSASSSARRLSAAVPCPRARSKLELPPPQASGPRRPMHANTSGSCVSAWCAASPAARGRWQAARHADAAAAAATTRPSSTSGCGQAGRSSDSASARSRCGRASCGQPRDSACASSTQTYCGSTLASTTRAPEAASSCKPAAAEPPCACVDGIAWATSAPATAPPPGAPAPSPVAARAERIGRAGVNAKSGSS
mmetsp:Transcript_41533/g.124142  ORF Transcript_41533/g.124142 Transcript_41533/m.124142 type:complete len:298 (-) Transcript_41533:362-1255(-)|eukprot:365630-Chlamydomonas_euryale.AAC.1